MAGELKVVLLPYVAFGHMMPFYQLSHALAKAGVHVYYVSTPKNIIRLPNVPPSVQPFLHLVEIPLPVPEDPSCALPEGAEATVDIPVEKIHFLNMAFDLLQQPFKHFVAGLSPDWIIIDFIPHWAADVARECGVPLMSFSAFSAATNVFFGPPEFLAGDGQKRVRSTPESLTSPPHWVSFPSKVAYRRFEAIGAMFGFYGTHSSAMSGSQRVAKTLDASRAVAIRSCPELEGEYLTLFSEILGKPVIPVGLLPPEQPKNREVADDSWAKIFNWLDGQKPKSVVFVGFGSECKLNKKEICEIAYGLEESQLPFLWALRKPNWATDDADALPTGFADRPSGQLGKVCFGWAPQTDILAHPAIGGSLFHAGWGSAIETLQFGHSLVLLPLIIDQGLNARLLVEKGLAIEVERDEQDGSFSRKDIAKALREAMVGSDKEDQTTTRKARLREVAAMVGDMKLHDCYIDEFVKFLRIKD